MLGKLINVKHRHIVFTIPEELRYALETLNADGFAFPTNTLGVYLGDPCLDPILEELNKHKAVVILHPNKPSSIPENVAEGLHLSQQWNFYLIQHVL